MFARLGESFTAHSIDEKTAFSLNLAAEELFTNFVRHNVGSGERITLEIDVTDKEFRFTFTDYDVEPWDPATAPDPDVDLPMEERSPGGLGIHLVKSVVDRLAYEYKNRVMKVTAIKKLER